MSDHVTFLILPCEKYVVLLGTKFSILISR